jgi:hypothetical protein
MKKIGLRGFFIIAIILSSCGQKPTKRILIKLSPQEITIENIKVDADKFQDELKKIIDDKVDDGYKREELIVSLRVDSETKRGMIADIETAMRKLNVRRVEYSTFK